MIYVVYMAAGNSRRFGSNKLLYEIDQKPMYRHVLDRLIHIAEHENADGEKLNIEIITVTQYDKIKDYCDKKIHCHAVYNADSYKGASYTIKAGIKEVLSKNKVSGTDYIMFMVADQPFLREESLIAFIDSINNARSIYGRLPEAFSMRCDGKSGNPCAFRASLIPELMELEGDRGGRKVIKDHDCVYVDIDDAGELADIDVHK